MEENLIDEQKKKARLKQVGKIIFYVFLVMLLAILSLVSLLLIYEDEVKSAILSKLNAQLNAEVKINPSDINITILKSFPDCSIEFKDVLMMEAIKIKKRDTLLFAKQINLYFNIIDLWNKKYNIKKIKIDRARVKIAISETGSSNYVFWKKLNNQSIKTNDTLSFKLNLITIKNSRLFYNDKQQQFRTEVAINQLDLKGNFTETDFELSTKGNLLVDLIASNNTIYLKKKTINFSVDLNIKGPAFAFNEARINLNKMALDFNGKGIYKDSLENLELNFIAPDMDIASVMSLLPKKVLTNIDDYNSTGNFYAKGELNYSLKNEWNIKSAFGIKNGEVTYKPKSTKLTSVNIEGDFNYSKRSSGLNLKNVNLKLNNDEIEGSCIIKDFKAPYLKLVTQAKVHLENLQSFYPIDTIKLLKGNLSINANLEGLISDLTNKTFSELVKLKLEGILNNVEVLFKGDEHSFILENCIIIAQDREIEVKDLKFKKGDSDIELNGKLPGFFKYILDSNSPLIIEGRLFSNYLRLEDLLPKQIASEKQNSAIIPKNINFTLKTEINKLSYSKFLANTISGQIEIKNQKAMISDMALKTMDGAAQIDILADNTGDNLIVDLSSIITGINIKQLFKSFNNFGQSTLIDAQINGLANVNINFSGKWNNRLEADLKSIEASGNISIDKGELINFKPLMSLSKYLKIEDLMHIRFSTLESNIKIKESIINFPKTAIKNSVLNLELGGTHSFDNIIDYQIRLLVSELKSKRGKSKQEDFGDIEMDLEDKRTIFIRMKGSIDNPKIEYDFKGLKTKIKEDIIKEKQTWKELKEQFKQDIGLGKKDTLDKKDKATQTKFELEKPKNNKLKPTLELKKKSEDDDDF